MKIIISLLLLIFFQFTYSLSGQKIISPPSELEISSFYKKYIDADGIPVICSSKVPDEALLKARDIIIMMMSKLKVNITDTMKARGVRIAVMARYEGTTDIPEHQFLEQDTSLNWDVRARGLGGTPDLPLTTCAEENLLCYQIDKYHAEDILVHEFAHTIHLVGIILNDSSFNRKLQSLLDNAKAKGKWENTYASTNYEEYWAEGVQSWFNVNADVPKPDGKHNLVNTREELKKYDPDLYHFIQQYFYPVKKTCSCHSK